MHLLYCVDIRGHYGHSIRDIGDYLTSKSLECVIDCHWIRVTTHQLYIKHTNVTSLYKRCNILGISKRLVN